MDMIRYLLLICSVLIAISFRAFAEQKPLISVYFGSSYEAENMQWAKNAAPACEVKPISLPEIENGLAVVFGDEMKKSVSVGRAMLDVEDFCIKAAPQSYEKEEADD